MNVRYFEAGTEWWFGGGIDLTPYYPRMGQVITFHRKLKELCEKHGQPYDQCALCFWLFAHPLLHRQTDL